jgi:hypothetical protein
MAGQGSFSPDRPQGADGRTGLWLVGAGGNVATTVALGLAALQRDATPPIGLTTELPPFQALDLAPWSHIALGGHDVRPCDPVATARILARDGVVTPALVDALAPDLETYRRAVRPGVDALAPATRMAPRASPRSSRTFATSWSAPAANGSWS